MRSPPVLKTRPEKGSPGSATTGALSRDRPRRGARPRRGRAGNRLRRRGAGRPPRRRRRSRRAPASRAPPGSPRGGPRGASPADYPLPATKSSGAPGRRSGTSAPAPPPRASTRAALELAAASASSGGIGEAWLPGPRGPSRPIGPRRTVSFAGRKIVGRHRRRGPPLRGSPRPRPRELDSDRARVQDRGDVAEGALEGRAPPVHLVDEGQPATLRRRRRDRGTRCGTGLRHRADEDDGPVESPEGTSHLGGEIHVTRRIDEIDAERYRARRGRAPTRGRRPPP